MQQPDDSSIEMQDQPADDGDSGQNVQSPAGDSVARELAEQKDKYLRLAAEYDNYRRRSMKERGEAETRGQAGLIKQLLDPLDDLSRFAQL
jgi:molecular chaperone GrpE